MWVLHLNFSSNNNKLNKLSKVQYHKSLIDYKYIIDRV